MGLFDHLFKNKPTSGEEGVEHPGEHGAAAKPAEGGPRHLAPQKADPSGFLHPKAHVPRGAPTVMPAQRPAAMPQSKPSDRRVSSSSDASPVDEIVLTLGDVLSRIPSHYLKPGSPDAKRELRFRINDLSSDIARGRAAVPLSRIVQLAPDIFVKQVSRDEDTEVRLPLQKLVEQIGLLRSRPKAPAVEKLRPTMSTPSAGMPPLGAGEEAAASDPGGGIPPIHQPVPLATPVTPIVLDLASAGAQASFELKPVAEPSHAAVVLGPPISAAEEHQVEPSVVPEIPLESESPRALAAEEPFIAPLISAEPEKAEEREETFPLPQPVASEAAAKIPDLGASPQLESAAEVAAEPAEAESGEETIQLSLAAILKHCPTEIVLGALPQVDDRVRITLPFAPIDRQLIKGHVEVSALRFIAALPEPYQKYFVPKVGVKVPIPLEEVFQNLPTPAQPLHPHATEPPPVFLSPARHVPAPAQVVPVQAVSVEPAAVSGESHAILEPSAAAETHSAPPSAPEPRQEEGESARPFINLPFAAFAEPAAASPTPSAVSAAFSKEEVVQNSEAPADTAPAAPAAVPETPSVPSLASARPEGEPQKLVLQPPAFRPHILPPPIFGIAPAPETAQSETPPASIPPEPPSIISALAQPPTQEPTAEAVKESETPAPAAHAQDATSHSAASDFQPSVDLIASAPEEGARETFGGQGASPAPLSDVADLLAHEGTYAEAHAQVVRIDEPYAQPVAASAPPQPEDEQPQAASTAESKEVPDAPSGISTVEVVHLVPEIAGTVAAGPAGAEHEAANGVASPGQSLFTPPTHAIEHDQFSVMPPAVAPLHRLDQDALQALFMTEEMLDLPKISRLAAALPGVYACVIATRDQACTGGTLPDGFDLAALLGLAPRVGEAAGRMPIGQLKHFTLYGEAYSVSFFERHGFSLCAVHRPRSFVPGVREKLVALADELSR